MTANAAQEIIGRSLWRRTLRGAREALRPGGRLLFESRDPAMCAWQEWNRETSRRVTAVPGVGEVESWVELIEADLPLVSFRWTYVFAADGAVLTTRSTLRFRERREIEKDLAEAGFLLEDVRDAPDRPGREFVFLARRPERTHARAAATEHG
ncbi:hypothetical protein EES43_00765 [Streptomyces sp. ADI96-02]|nr:hypothetical protein EES43_00765 [Streptomyces sp. ADI96-02]